MRRSSAVGARAAVVPWISWAVRAFGDLEHVEADADRGAVGRNFGACSPGAVGVAIEAVAGLGGAVDRGLIYAGLWPRLGDGGGGGGQGEQDG